MGACHGEVVGMKVVFDLGTPKTTLFFHAIGEPLRSRGHEIVYVSRAYREANAIQEMLGLNVAIFGRHGGLEAAGKAAASTERQRQLTDFFRREEPDVLVCLSSVEASRAAYALGIPIACFNDLPEAEHTARLTIPLAATVLAPSVIPARTYEQLGARRVFAYRALDPIAWLNGYVPRSGSSTNGELGATANGHARTVVFREEEVEAAYLRGTASVVVETVNGLAGRHPDWLFVGIPRYSPAGLAARTRASNILVVDHAVNTIALLADADLFLGGGGTMNIEAAYFGTPTICCRPIVSRYETWLVGNGLAKKPAALTPAVIGTMAEGLAGERSNPAQLREMIFPTGAILDEIERTGGLPIRSASP
jgi:predicted glycosyltransferase